MKDENVKFCENTARTSLYSFRMFMFPLFSINIQASATPTDSQTIGCRLFIALSIILHISTRLISICNKF